MTRKTIENIISTYFKNNVPDYVKDNFETWMSEPDDFAEKSEVLEELWDSSWGDGSELPSAETVMADAESVKTRKFSTRYKRRGAFLWISSAAAVVLAVLSVTLFLQKRTVETCLASSEGAKGSFVLPDGSQVYLNMGSKLYYSSKLEGKTRTVRLEGEGFFNVTKDTERPFIVQAHGIDITVLGTEFTVTAYNPEKVCTYLQKGRVIAMGPKLNRPIRLFPNQALIYDGERGTYTQKATTAANHTLWIRDKLEFEKTSLFDICETLSHWYNVEIVCQDELLARNCELSLTVRQEPIYEILNAIEALAPVSHNMESASHVTIVAR